MAKQPRNQRSNAKAARISPDLEVLIERLGDDLGLVVGHDDEGEAGWSYHWHDPDDLGNCENPVYGGAATAVDAVHAAITTRLDEEETEADSWASDVYALVDGVKQALGVDLWTLLDDEEWPHLDDETRAARISAAIRTGLLGSPAFRTSGTVLSA